MKKLHDDDYLIEITIRLAVHKKDAAALLSLAGPPNSDDHSDHNCLDYRAASIRRIASVELFDDFHSPDDLAR